MAIFGSSYGSVGKPASRGLAVPGMFGRPQGPSPSDPMTDQYKLYNTAVQQQAGDYGNIMKGFQDLRAKAPSSEFTSAVGNLGELAKTGGFSPEAIADIRARGVSPIRSVYAGAMRDVDRQRGLQGGYSPNYGAVRAKMAREQSEQVGQGVTNVNAQIAQMIAQNRLGASGQYASAAGKQDDTALNALQGMTSLYGTTPAMASLFGNQALQGAQLQSNINQQGQQGNMQLIDQFIRGLGR